MPSSSSRWNLALTWCTVSGASAVVWLWTTSNGIPAILATSMQASLSLPPEYVSSRGFWYRYRLISLADCRRFTAASNLSTSDCLLQLHHPVPDQLIHHPAGAAFLNNGPLLQLPVCLRSHSCM